MTVPDPLHAPRAGYGALLAPAVEQRVSPEFRDHASACCLRCGMAPDGFVISGTEAGVRELVREHAGTPGHTVRWWPPQAVWELSTPEETGRRRRTARGLLHE